MASKVTTLFEDSAKQNALYPRTKVSAISDNSSNSLQQLLDAKQATLVSGTNIKTVESTSLLGSGNIPLPRFIDTSDLIVEYNSTSTPNYVNNNEDTAVVTWGGSSSKRDIIINGVVVAGVPNGESNTAFAYLKKGDTVEIKDGINGSVPTAMHLRVYGLK